MSLAGYCSCARGWLSLLKFYDFPQSLQNTDFYIETEHYRFFPHSYIFKINNHLNIRHSITYVTNEGSLNKVRNMNRHI
jgi:hypothetical protein